MKLTRTLGSVALLAFAGSAFADQTIEITGSTAFRVGAVKSIIALYGTGLTDIAHTGTTNSATGHESASDSIFRGTIANAATPGITTIRCSWSGSVEGVAALVNLVSENYLTTAAFGSANGLSYAGPASATNTYQDPTKTAFTQTGDTDSEIAFSDVFSTSTPYSAPANDDIVGILPFFCVINDGAPAAYTNMQAQKFGQLIDAGFLPAKFLFPTTSTTNVFLTGRNDGSGTRSTYVAISRGGQPGFGRNQTEKGDLATVVQQWRPIAAVSDEITEIQLWPTGAGTEASIIWGPDVAGNGGYPSGGTVAARLAAKTTSVQRKNAGGTNIGTPVPAHLVSIVGLSDAVTAQTGSARILAWDGESITVTNPLASTEEDKFKNGSYTLWSYEHMFSGTLSTAEAYVKNQLKALIPANLSGAGIDATLMNVKRNDDGTDVIPK